jgi:hypothetical protein
MQRKPHLHSRWHQRLRTPLVTHARTSGHTATPRATQTGCVVQKRKARVAVLLRTVQRPAGACRRAGELGACNAPVCHCRAFRSLLARGRQPQQDATHNRTRKRRHRPRCGWPSPKIQVVGGAAMVGQPHGHRPCTLPRACHPTPPPVRPCRQTRNACTVPASMACGVMRHESVCTWLALHERCLVRLQRT